jgi:hypothetical protein
MGCGDIFQPRRWNQRYCGTGHARRRLRRNRHLLVEHAEDGAYGLILYQTTDLTVRDAWAQSHDTPCLIDGVVCFGGPCGEFLTALHGKHAFSNIEVAPGLHYSQEPAKLVQVVEQQVDPVRFLVGFAGWDTGQLQAERIRPVNCTPAFGCWARGRGGKEGAVEANYWQGNQPQKVAAGEMELLPLAASPGGGQAASASATVATALSGLTRLALAMLQPMF